MPYAAAAARIAHRVGEGPWELAVMPLDEGKAFVTLPMPVDSRLPIHVHGRWQISDDRNTLAPQSHAEAFEWNSKLAGQVAAAAYANLLRAIACKAHPPLLASEIVDSRRADLVHQLLPPHNELRAPFTDLSAETYAILSRRARCYKTVTRPLPHVGYTYAILSRRARRPVPHVVVREACAITTEQTIKSRCAALPHPFLRPSDTRWLPFLEGGTAPDVRVLHAMGQPEETAWRSASNVLFLEGLQGKSEGVTDQVVRQLLKAGFPITDAPASALMEFQRNGLDAKQLSKQSACAWANEHGDELAAWLSSQPEEERRVWCRTFLQFVLQGATSELHAALLNVPVLLLQDGSISRLRPAGRRAGEDLLIDLQPTAAGVLVKGVANELLPRHENLFLEDAGEDEGSVARLLWPHMSEFAVRSFSPSDAVERLLDDAGAVGPRCRLQTGAAG